MKEELNKNNSEQAGNSNHNNRNAIKSYLYLLLMIAVYVIVMSYLSIIKFESFSASVYDLGIMIQTIWNTSNGWILQESINMGYPMMRFWMAHWEFIYIPIALIYKIFSSPYTILIVQSIVVSLGVFPIYWLAKEKLRNEIIAYVFSLSYLLYPAIQNANLCDIHGVTLAAPFLLFTFYYLQKRDIKLFTLFAFIAVLCREDSALVLFMLGIYAFLILKEKRLGIVVSTVSILWFLVWYERMAIRSMAGLPEFIIMEGAETHWGHLSNVTGDPLYIVKFLAKKHNIRYLFNIFGPVGFLSFFSPLTLLIATPMFAINLLSSYYYTHEVEHYYSATIAPFIYVSAIYGAKKLLSYFEKNNKLNYFAIVILLCSVFFFFIKSNVFDIKKWKITEHHKVIKKVITKIPKHASLTAENKLAAHAAERHEIYVFDDNIDKVDYILYDFYAPTVTIITRTGFQLHPAWPDNDSIRKVLYNKDYGVVHYEDGVCLFKKNADYEDGIKKLAISTETKINNVINREIRPGVYCKGYNSYNMLSYYEQPEKLGPIYWKKALHFTCFWSSVSDNPDTLNLIFKIKSDNQEFIISHSSVFGLYPATKWKNNELIRDEVFWEIPDEAEPGLYQIYAAFKPDKAENNFIYLFDMEIK